MSDEIYQRTTNTMGPLPSRPGREGDREGEANGMIEKGRGGTGELGREGEVRERLVRVVGFV